MRKIVRNTDSNSVNKGVVAKSREVADEMEFAGYRMYIASKDNKLARITYNATGDVKVSGKTYDLEEKFTRKDLLVLLIDSFKKATEDIAEVTLSEPVIIYAPGAVVDNIEKDNFKFWAMTGRFGTGEEIEEHELVLWREFVELYCSVGGAYVMIKNISSAKSNLAITKLSGEELIDAKYSGKAWERVSPIAEEEIEEEA